MCKLGICSLHALTWGRILGDKLGDNYVAFYVNKYDAYLVTCSTSCISLCPFILDDLMQ